MSINVENGFKFDKNYSFQEVNELLNPIKNKMQTKTQELFFAKVISKFLYIYDSYFCWGESAALDRLKKYMNPPAINWSLILADIDSFVNEKIQSANKDFKRSPEYDLSCSIRIFPAKDKLLFLLYGEQVAVNNILTKTPFVKEYCYSNQYDKPENISEKEWMQRCKDWMEFGPHFNQGLNGFSVDFTNEFLHSTTNIDYLLKTNIKIPDINKRARILALDVKYKEKINIPVLISDEYQRFLKEQTNIIKKRLLPLNTLEDFVKILS